MQWVSLRAGTGASRRRRQMLAGVGVAFALAVSAAAQGQGPARSGLQLLPLTQLDEETLGTDLDSRAVTLTLPQPTPIAQVLLQLVAGTSLSIVPEPGVTGTFSGDLKGVSVRQALGLVLPPLGLDYAVDGAIVRVFKRQPDTRIFDINYIAATRIGISRTGEDAAGGSFARVDTTAGADLFSEIAAGVKTLVSSGAAFNVDRKAGLLQVTDAPERLDRVAAYLDAVHERIHRQVQIEARVLEVELSDPEAESLDWTALAASAPDSRETAYPRILTGLKAGDVPRFLAALAAQGKVSLLAHPTVSTLNNEPALVKGASGDRIFSLGVMPQVSANGVITLSLSPIVSTRAAPGTPAAAPAVLREADALARIADGESIVVAGFTRELVTRETKNLGSKGGWLGRSTVVTRRRVELLVVLTSTLVRPVGEA